MLKLLLCVGIIAFHSSQASLKAYTQGNQIIRNFRDAKRVLPKIFKDRPLTLYCNCKYMGKLVDLKSCDFQSLQPSIRTRRIEWEHVVPAEAFGQSFKEWRLGAPHCRTKRNSYKGRRCAKKNPEFNFMEADLYNLFPEVGELNAARSNYSMAEIAGFGKFLGLTYGGCKSKVFNKKFEPMDHAKGVVARTYFYMEWAYPGHGIVSDKNEKLFKAWDKLHPVEPWECQRYLQIKQIQKNDNPFLKVPCESLSKAGK